MAKCKECGAEAPRFMALCADCRVSQGSQTTDEGHRRIDGVENPFSYSGGTYIGWAIASSIGAGILCLLGIYRMYNYDQSDKIVGGDAYNYIILTNRGLGLVCSSIVLMLFSCILVLISIAKRLALPNDEKLMGNSGPV